MGNDKDEFLKKLLVTFRVEAEEHLEAMSSGLLALERAAGGDRAAIVERIFREAHSLKGAARAVNLADVETVCHSLESLFAAWKHDRVAATAGLFDVLHEVLDGLRSLLSSDRSAASGNTPVPALIRKLDAAWRSSPPAVQPPEAAVEALPRSGDKAFAVAAPGASLGAATVKVHTEKLDSIMRQTEELLGPRLAAEQRLIDLRETRAAFASWKKQRDSLQPTRRAVEKSLASGRTNGAARGRAEVEKLLQSIEGESMLVRTLEDQLAKLERAAASDHRSLAGIVDGLLHDVKETQMLPFSSLVDGLQRVVRDLARDEGKQAQLVTEGGDLQIDRRILEEMRSPLNHLLRNCIDHGIEKPAVREQKGKPPQGTVTVALTARDSRVDISIADDGAGIDLAKMKAAAARLALVPADGTHSWNERDMLSLIFHSGFSTSPIITEVSGRGLGLAIVREKVDQLGGTIAVETRPDAGTTVRIDLPLTLATFRGVLVRAGDQQFIIPAAGVERVARIACADIRTVENRETISLDGQTISLVSLSEVLELTRAAPPRSGHAQVVVLGVGAGRVAFRVDAVVAEQEVLVRRFGAPLARVRNVAGASVVGTGEVVPVLNVADLMHSAVRSPATPLSLEPSVEAEAVRSSVLVVEDSITSRTLLKNILEAAGYDVAVAVDGIDAWTALRSRAFDLIVSDVEMPRMDGFELTAKVRADQRLSGLPVVLVTALESREHRERGIDAGANAYIVKSSFDQSHLLEIIRRLI